MDYRQLPLQSLYFWPGNLQCTPEVLLFGTGGRGQEFRTFLEKRGVRTIAYIDNDTARQGAEVGGLKVLAPSAARKLHPDVPVVICSHAHYEIYLQIKSLFTTVYVDFTPFAFQTVAELEAFETRYAENVELLEDEPSRRSYAGHVACLLMEEPKARSVSDYPYLRHPLVHAEPGDTILNIGAYLGGPAINFCKQTANNCTVHAFEPSPYLFNVMCKNLLEAGISKHVVPVCAAISTDPGYVWFYDSLSVGGGNVSSDKGDMVVYAHSVDSYVQATGIKPDLIQVGRGGLDLMALKGATETIRRFKPRIIASVLPCHTEVLAFLKDLVADYTFYFADHTFVWKEIEYVGFLYTAAR